MSDPIKENDDKTLLTEGHQPLQKGHTAVNVSNLEPKPPSGGSGVVNNSTNNTTTNSTTSDTSSSSNSSSSATENKTE